MLPPEVVADHEAGKLIDYSRIKAANPLHQDELNQLLGVKPKGRIRSFWNRIFS